jgi:hypothetical protein
MIDMVTSGEYEILLIGLGASILIGLGAALIALVSRK